MSTSANRRLKGWFRKGLSIMEEVGNPITVENQFFLIQPDYLVTLEFLGVKFNTQIMHA